MTEQFLQRSNVVTIGEQLGRKRMTQRVAPDMLHKAGLASGLGHGPLDDRLVQMVTGRRFICASCSHEWEVPYGTGRPDACDTFSAR